jgi:DNA-binding transcriptional ArsR family regulator
MHSMNAARLDTVFGALADPSRRAILMQLSRGEATVGELCAPLDVKPPTVSRHLRVLEHADLIVVTKDAQRRRCRLRDGALDAAQAWIAETKSFWSDSLDKLEALALAQGNSPPRSRRRRRDRKGR